MLVEEIEGMRSTRKTINASKLSKCYWRNKVARMNTRPHRQCIIFILPLTVKEAVEVWLPTVKVTVPESAVVTPRSLRLCTQPSDLIRFISLFCSGTSWSFHWARGASSRETRHSKRTSSPWYTTQLSKNFSIVTSTSV